MAGFTPTRAWSRGSNNVAPSDRLPEGFVRHAVNIDPLPGGRLKLRAGYEQIYAGTAVRGVLALGDKLLVADGTSLVEVNTVTNSTRVLRTIAGAGYFAGDVLNGVLYFCTANECLEYDGTAVRPWGVVTAVHNPSINVTNPGGLQAGYYRVAFTHVDAWGREGGSDVPVTIGVEQDKSLRITVPQPPAGLTTNVYVGANHGATLYKQANVGSATVVEVTTLRDDTARLTTELLRAPTPGRYVASHNGVVAIATGSTLQLTRPMQPHLVDRARGFLSYPIDINMVLSDGKRLYVGADVCYALTNVETDGIEQRRVLEYPAVTGTAVMLPDGRGAWMTMYGQAITDDEGNVALPNRGSFAPATAAEGTAGVVDVDGNQLILTALKGKTGGNPLAASDFFIGEIVNP